MTLQIKNIAVIFGKYGKNANRVFGHKIEGTDSVVYNFPLGLGKTVSIFKFK